MPHAVLRFGVFDLNPATGELHRAGLRVRLQPQPVRVLEILATRAGTIVSREELRQAVWGEGTFVDFEHGLNFCINQVRRALGDSATAPRFVETVPRRGYRFIAPVERIEPFVGQALAPAPPVAAPAPRFHAGWR
ncbi:MAG TPA: transcriptional regulator, partial [Vicinamibacteria bacterium]|nr:transcriptional regulator [Vicinamibacteria bacterium]